MRRTVCREFTYVEYREPFQMRFLQALNGRFLCFAPISYVSPQKPSTFGPIYHQWGPSYRDDGICYTATHQSDGLPKQEDLHLMTCFREGIGMQKGKAALVGSSEPQALLMRTRLIVFSFARVKSLLLERKEQHQFQPMAFYPIWGSGGRDSSCK